MGYASALGMVEAVGRWEALPWHLGSNHYPPLPISLVPTCISAVEAVEDGDPQRLIELPEGIEYQDGRVAPAWAIVEGMHLDAFIRWEDD